MWVITVLSLCGVVLNIHKHKECFYIWAFTNGVWCVYDWNIGAKEQSVLFAVYFVLALWGIIKWQAK